MKAALALAATLALAGCASDGYYASGYGGYGGYGYYDQPYSYYSYGYPYYYTYPSVGGTIYYYDRDGRRGDGRHDGRWRDRDRDGRHDWRDRNDGHPDWRGPDRGRGRAAIGDANPAEHLPNWRDRDGDGRFDPGEGVRRDNPLGRGAEGR